MSNNKVIYIIGVSGSGKTTIGNALSENTGFPFYDGDDFHSDQNINKMKAGQPLNDADRRPWLLSINKFVKDKLKDNSLIIACSALKQQYRDLLEDGLTEKFQWVHLENDFDTIAERLKSREGHFMPPDLLTSQFDDLELPTKALIITNTTVDGTIQKIMEVLPKKEFGFVGLGVMGKSLSRNLADKGFALSLYNRHVDGTEVKVAQNFIRQYPVLKNAYGFDNLSSFSTSLSKPRKIFLMVPAGKATDSVIDELVPFLEAGAILIDGGNAHYKDTERRQKHLATLGISLIGAGVSGGEEGALKGPAIMPSGDPDAYKKIQPYLEKIAAKNTSGLSCCSYLGTGSAGHFVKMVHNGIEYAEMQLLAELYAILRYGMQYTPDQIAAVFETWNQTDLNSYLLEITIDILRKKENDGWLIDKILDKAGNKGTGSWTTIAASELGVPIPTMTAALFARYNSAFKTDRVKAESIYPISHKNIEVDLAVLKQAYHLARIVNHHEGFQLIQAASTSAGWQIDLARVAQIWTNGCIIRSAFMNQLTSVLKEETNLLMHPSIKEVMINHFEDMQNVVIQVIPSGVAIPCFSAALQHFQTYIKAQSSANIIQAQRDYFGAHQYRRVDGEEGVSYHTDWI